jgi:hypothetical protein
MKPAGGVRAQERLAVERWTNEGGRIAGPAAGEGSSTAHSTVTRPPSSRKVERPRVLIAGGGVAGLETLLALRSLAADRVEITILAPELKFVNLSMSVEQPFQVQRGRGLRLEDTAAELGAAWHRGALDRVEHDQHRVVTKNGDALPYDRLVAPTSGCCSTSSATGGWTRWRSSNRLGQAGRCRFMTWR